MTAGGRGIGDMMSKFERAKRRFSSGSSAYSPPEIREVVEGLERAALVAVCDENERGGYARQVVASVARLLNVDIDEGPGHRWDKDHMERVVAGARELCDEMSELKAQASKFVEERDNATEQAELWRKLAERQDNTAPLRMELRVAERERDDFRRQLSLARDEIVRLRGLAPAEDDADELKATIVRQAREITRLKGKSE